MQVMRFCHAVTATSEGMSSLGNISMWTKSSSNTPFKASWSGSGSEELYWISIRPCSRECTMPVSGGCVR